MYISLFDMFKIGIGPSSSHTVGPMRAARRFLFEMDAADFARIHRVEVELYGSLAHTGHGHGTDMAIMLGLEGELPDHVDTAAVPRRIHHIRAAREISLLGKTRVHFDPDRELIFNRVDLLELGVAAKKPLHEMLMENEIALHGEVATREFIGRMKKVMFDCIDRGMSTDGMLPGGLKVNRRAKAIAARLNKTDAHVSEGAMNWVSVYAIAVNEENAAGGRVVTAPTNGAAGVVPAVLRYYQDFRDADDDGITRFVLAAAAIGALCKRNASISGAEVGCQGEVGSAAAMAAGGLAAALGASNEQIENAAEIALEHHLGMTCDPIGGLVQIPCIERNAMGAVKAINACSLAMLGDGSHMVSLDQAIETMRRTGADMQTKYKETSLGGLAITVSVRQVEC
ncbi:MAG: L-serine ammonia-lyase [Usitatibacteraceae bacterium]